MLDPADLSLFNFRFEHSIGTCTHAQVDLEILIWRAQNHPYSGPVCRYIHRSDIDPQVDHFSTHLPVKNELSPLYPRWGPPYQQT